MKKNLIIGFVLLSFLFMIDATVEAQVKSNSFGLALKLMLSSKTPTVTVDEAVQLRNTVFLDSREAVEYNVSHLPNARFAGYNNFEVDQIDIKDKSTPIVVYCSVGKRSEDVTMKLIKAGYSNVQNLYGGIFEWINSGYAVYNNANVAVNMVHAYNKVWGIWVHGVTKVY